MRQIAIALLLCCAWVATASPSLDDITADNVLRLMNEKRVAEGLLPLRAHDRLMLAAADRMRHMEEESFWSHKSPDGVTPFVWLRVRAYDFRAAGENLANGFETARLLVDAWMESPGHRANILSAAYEDCGVAIIDGSTRGPASGKSIVVLFARQSDSAETLVARESRQQ